MANYDFKNGDLLMCVNVPLVYESGLVLNRLYIVVNADTHSPDSDYHYCQVIDLNGNLIRWSYSKSAWFNVHLFEKMNIVADDILHIAKIVQMEDKTAPDKVL